MFKALFVPVTVDEDSISDWSTDSCGWSDDDYGVDLDVTTPPLSVDSGAVDTNDQEIVRCICEVEEENDFMIQVSWLFFLTTCTWSIFKALQAFLRSLRVALLYNVVLFVLLSV